LIILDLNGLTNDENSNYDNDSRINKLDIPNGLKEMLINHQFTIERLYDTSPDDLSTVLGIDDSVARIIINAVKKLHDEN
jgi:DNA integrity scanning protein DisA with diadenylate cyclase activity